MIKIALFGASPDTSNMGVSALFAATIQGITKNIPEARFVVFDYGLGKRQQKFNLGGGVIAEVDLVGLRAGHKYYKFENMTNASFFASLGKLGAKFSFIVEELDSCTAILDVSGGDSFSDIYGRTRFMSVLKPKLLAQQRHKPVFLLPQTYGPFISEDARKLATQVVKSVEIAWSRDEESFQILKSLLGEDFDENRHRGGIDLAFGLEPTEVSDGLDSEVIEKLSKAENGKLNIGFNVSGLIYNEPDKAISQYKFKADYRKIVHDFLSWLIDETDANIFVVPHVMAYEHINESDYGASLAAVQHIGAEKNSRVTVIPNSLDQSQVKWVIANMDWFCGTRMHSTIASLSSGVATSAVAYSDKTRGVFDTCGQVSQVFDPRVLETEDVITHLKKSYNSREEIAESLAENLPKIRQITNDQLKQISESIMMVASGQSIK